MVVDKPAIIDGAMAEAEFNEVGIGDGIGAEAVGLEGGHGGHCGREGTVEA